MNKTTEGYGKSMTRTLVARLSRCAVLGAGVCFSYSCRVITATCVSSSDEDATAVSAKSLATANLEPRMEIRHPCHVQWWLAVMLLRLRGTIPKAI